MQYNFDKIAEREGTSCLKYDKRGEVFGCEDVIPMWIADMDFEVAPCITHAIKQRAEHPLYGYEFRNDNYFNSVINWVGKRNGWHLQKEWMEYTPGVVAGLVFSLLALSDEGDKVVIQPPVYPPFYDTIRGNKREIVTNPLVCKGDTFEIDFDDLDRKLDGARILMFCNPHNPTGRIFTREELTRIGELCVKHNVYIISDEIHCDLTRKPHKHLHIASLDPEFAKRTITLIAPSKSFNVAGMNTSVAIIPSDSVRRMFQAETAKYHVCSGNCFGNVVLETAYNHCEEWLDEMMEYVGENIDYAKAFIAEKLPSVKAYNCGGTFLLWMDFTAWGMDCDQLQEFLIRKAGLGLNCGRHFGPEGESHARMNLATSRAKVQKALDQLYEASKQLNL